MKTKFYTINENASTFILLRRKGLNLCYCILCNTLFNIEIVFYDHIYKCKKCDNVSVLEKDNTHHKLYLELIRDSETDRCIKIIDEIFTYRLNDPDDLLSDSNASDKNLKKVGILTNSEKKVFDFSPKSLSQNIDGVNPHAVYPTDFEDAIVGYAERCGSPPLILLDREKCIEILMKDMDRDEAVKYFKYNILGSYVGEGTPIFMTKIVDI